MHRSLAWFSIVTVALSVLVAAPRVARADSVTPPAHRIRAYLGTGGIGLAYGFTVADAVPIELAGGWIGAGTGQWAFVQGRLGARVISTDVPAGTTGIRTSFLVHGGLLHTRFSGASDGYPDHHNSIDAIMTGDLDLTYIGTSGTGFSMGVAVGVAVPLSQDIQNSRYKENPPNAVRPYLGLQLGYAF